VREEGNRSAASQVVTPDSTRIVFVTPDSTRIVFVTADSTRIAFGHSLWLSGPRRRGREDPGPS
jgi:hypothetical protein